MHYLDTNSLNLTLTFEENAECHQSDQNQIYGFFDLLTRIGSNPVKGHVLVTSQI